MLFCYDAFMRFLGIDYGTKKIGLALSDEGGRLAFPHSVFNNISASDVLWTSDAVSLVKKICEDNNVGKIVLGQSLDYKGQPNPVMKEIEKFKILLEKETKLPVIFETETLTTKQAVGSSKNNEKIHSSAAALILQTYLDRRHQE